MTQEDKQLLLKDLSGRLFYGVKGIYTKNGFTEHYDSVLTPFYYGEVRMSLEGYRSKKNYVEFKPYLRPMSSMTEEEKKELKSATCPEGTGYFDEQYLICPMSHFGEHISYSFMSDILNWLNAHHFDYRGLIEKGLALEAPEGMYKTE